MRLNSDRVRRALLGCVLLFGLGSVSWKLGPSVYNARKLQRLEGRRVYDINANAEAALATALQRARSGQKLVLVILGGNWCRWCLALDDLMHSDPEIAAVLRDRYSMLTLDADVAATLDRTWGNPTRLGVPVLVILDQNGKLLRVQDSTSLEAFGGRLLLHDRARLLAALRAPLA